MAKLWERDVCERINVSFVSLSLPGDGRVVWPYFHGI